MAEILTNTGFDSDINGWSDDGYEYDSGWAKAYIATEGVYTIWQDIALTGTSSMTSALMSADIKYAVSGVDSYLIFRLKLRAPDGTTWYTPKTSSHVSGTYTWEDWADNVDVLADLQAGGDGTWRIAFSIEKVDGGATLDFDGWWDDCSLVITQEFSDSSSETVSLSESTSDSITFGGSASETVTLSESTSSTITTSSSATETVHVTDNTASLALIALDVDYGYYLGSFDGKMYRESDVYKSDDGVAIDAYHISKQTDFADEDTRAINKDKTILMAKLWYIDKYANASVSVSVSNDGGQTWNEVLKTIGTGDETAKSATYHFHITGQHFQFRIRSNSSTDDFQWIGLEVFYQIFGEHFEQ